MKALRTLTPEPHCLCYYVGARIARRVVKNRRQSKSSACTSQNDTHRVKVQKLNAVREFCKQSQLLDFTTLQVRILLYGGA
jgi:hypothetical protein